MSPLMAILIRTVAMSAASSYVYLLQRKSTTNRGRKVHTMGDQPLKHEHDSRARDRPLLFVRFVVRGPERRVVGQHRRRRRVVVDFDVQQFAAAFNFVGHAAHLNLIDRQCARLAVGRALQYVGEIVDVTTIQVSVIDQSREQRRRCIQPGMNRTQYLVIVPNLRRLNDALFDFRALLRKQRSRRLYRLERSDLRKVEITNDNGASTTLATL